MCINRRERNKQRVSKRKANVMIQRMSLYYAKITDGSRERTLRLWF